MIPRLKGERNRDREREERAILRQKRMEEREGERERAGRSVRKGKGNRER